MKSSNEWLKNIGVIARTISVVVLAVVFIGISITPALARDHDRYGHDRGRHRGHPRGYYYRPAPVYPVYPAPVYVPPPPPPVVYAPPPPPPGITFVFPIRVR